MKLAQSNKLEIWIYTADMIKVIGSTHYLWYIQIPMFEGGDIPCYKPSKQCCFVMCGNSWTVLDTALQQFGLYSIQCQLETSQADYPRKKKSQKNIFVSKPGKNMCSSKEHSYEIQKSEKYHVNLWVIQEDKEETSKSECQASVKSMEDDKNCQSNNCVNMQSVTKSTCVVSQISNCTICLQAKEICVWW